MVNLWHISDLHLTFNAQKVVQKPMDQRKWSKGSQNYVGYLHKIADFGRNKISNSDFVAITGDLTHEMPHELAIHNINWCRANINGTLLFILGNHDQKIKLSKLRMEFAGHKVFFLEEGEVITIGPYTFGCYSNHRSLCHATEKDGDKDDPRYLDMAQQIVGQSIAKKTIPVMLSHYPMPIHIAKWMGQVGLKAYLSGHVHCTQGSAPDGNDWEWYNKLAAPTDDKKFGTCFFSTGTTDVLLNKHGQIFKRIECLETSVMSEAQTESFKQKAANAFGVNVKQVKKFEKEDPFNPGNLVTGFICQKKGKMQGSIYITHVNGIQTDPQLIYGTPKLDYPYKDTTSRELLTNLKGKTYVFNEKWNGMNVVFYKYHDAHGVPYFTAKSKGTTFLGDGEFGNFLSLTREALGLPGGSIMEHIPEDLMALFDDNYQSISFELCGWKEPHLVKYGFPIAMKPLFATDVKGRITPDVDHLSNVVQHDDSKPDLLTEWIKWHQNDDLHSNTKYREKNNLPHKYEHDHFITEGKVLYVLDDDGFVKDRTLYKIKPSDVEDVHWSSFDQTLAGRVEEAVNKIKMLGEEITEKTLMEELDMGPKEWGRFGKDIMSFITRGPINSEREVIVLVGTPCSGKSTFAKMLEATGRYVRINQDDTGSKRRCKINMENALKEGKSVVVDRVNFDENQRKTWIDIALNNGVTNIRSVTFTTSIEECKERLKTRENHPTIKDVDKGIVVIDKMASLIKPPQTSEGFSETLSLDGKLIYMEMLVHALTRVSEDESV